MTNVTETTNILIAVYNALRAEVIARSAEQDNSLEWAVTAIAALGGVAFSDKSKRDRLFVLLFIPAITGGLGLIWFDMAENLNHLGAFMRYCLYNSMRDVTGYAALPNWESFLAGQASDSLGAKTVGHLRTIGPPFLVFICIPSVALLYATAKLDETHKGKAFGVLYTVGWVVVGVNLVLLGYYVIQYTSTYKACALS